MATPAEHEFRDKTDAQVLALAQAMYHVAEGLPARSTDRRETWDLFDRAMGELLRRAMSQVLHRIDEMQQAGEADVPDPELAATILEVMGRNPGL